MIGVSPHMERSVEMREMLNGKRLELPSDKGEKIYRSELPEDSGKGFTQNISMARQERDIPQKQGGSYGEIFRDGEGDFCEVHHMPADSASFLERNDGPAIRMEKEDHRMTASCGNSREAREYRANQAELIEHGKFREALQMDIDDIREKFGKKYNEAIDEMMTYVDKLEKEGKLYA